MATALPLDLLVVALSPKLLDVLFAEALLSLTLLLEDLYGLIEGLNGRPLHLDFLQEETRRRGRRGECHVLNRSQGSYTF